MNRLLRAVLLFLIAAPAIADSPADQSPTQAEEMNNLRLQELIEGIGDDVEGRPGHWQFTLQEFPTTVITDEKADRMRIIVPVAAISEVDSERLLRLMQANFDSALDARYSVARGVLWSAFIHPLSTLSEQQFVDGLAQTVNLAATYGTTYSSGALIFGGGDSKQEQNKYYREIIERANSI
jgi:hypothetical protein